MDDMDEQDFRTNVGKGLAVMRTGSETAAKATDEISNDASHPALKAALEEGNSKSKEWAGLIARAIEQVGMDGQQENPILEAHYKLSQSIRRDAKEATSRDLGIIASGQLALHYWIAAFGTMASYTGKLGLADVAGGLKAAAEDAKRGDEKCSAIARQLLDA